ncbi:ABC transporter substrate-binding protein [Paenibacillus thalictri]|uniref:Extracellular solute-binding protein n=1 Tax=Paenibacillus thalictri TaxID=2527873 RepID=A0A4V2J405_9BACL|nr:extracellular solute-binding protein [Paenibacillus thalictri]TBL76585.1 extracellular solute-binding protein [Paenibacillus thalictri]
MKAISKTVCGSLALLFVLSGCASPSPGPAQAEKKPDNEAKPKSEAKPGEKVKINYWTQERGRADFLKSKVEKFNQTNQDNIEVTLTILSDNYAQAVDIAFASGQAPDVFNVGSAVLGPLSTLVGKNYLEPLDGYMTPELKQRYDSMRAEGTNMYKGKMYSFPNYGNSYRLIYNVDLLEKAGYKQPPKTLDEMVDAAKKITAAGKASGIYGFSLPYKSAQSAMRRSAQVIATQSGYESSGFDFKTGKYDFSGYQPIIQSFRQMWADGSTLPGSESLDIDPLRAQFAEGKIGMYFSAAVEPGVYDKQFPTKIKWAAAPVPTQSGNPGGAAYLEGGTWVGISKDSKFKDKAWKFLEYMYSKEILMETQEVAGWLSIVPEIVAKAKVPSIAGTEYFLPGKYDAIWPLPPENIKPEGKTSDQEFVDYILVGGNLDEVIKRLNQKYNAALEKSGQQVKPDPSFDPVKLQGK